MRVVVVGSAQLAEQVASAVAAAADRVVLVLDVPDPQRLEAAPAVEVVIGDPLVPATLERAGARRAEVLAVCTSSDQVNLSVSLLAKRLFSVQRVIASLNDLDNAWLFGESWGVDIALSPARVLTEAILETPAAVGAHRGVAGDGATAPARDG